MPFSSLSPAKQSFLSRYFKPKAFFKAGAADTNDRNSPEALAAFKTARDKVEAKLAQLVSSGLNLSKLTAKLKSADDLVADPKSARADKALKLVNDLLPKIAKLGDNFCKAHKKRSKKAVGRVKGYLGMALELPKLEARYAKLETACGKDPVDYGAVKTASDAIIAKQELLKARSRGYKNVYKQVKKKIKEWCEDELPTITDDLVKDGRAKVVANIALAHQKLEEFSFHLANKMAQTIWWEIEVMQKLIKERDDYLVLKTAAEVEIKKLTDKRNPAVEDACNTMVADQAKAQTFEDNKAYYDAIQIMAGMAKRVAVQLPIAEAFEAYDTAAKAAQTALAELKSHPQAAYIHPDYLDIATHFEAAEALAAGQKYAKATIKMELLPERCKALIAKAAEAAPYDDLAKNAGTGDLSDLLKQAKALLAGLKSHPRASLAPQALKDLERDIGVLETAVNGGDEPAARAALTQVAELAVGTRKLLDAIDMLHARADRLSEQEKALRATHAKAAYVRTQLDSIAKLVTECKAGAIKGEDGLVAKLDDGERQYEEANRLANAEEAYRLRRDDIKGQVTAISDGAVEFPDKVKTVAKIGEHMTASDEHSKAFNHIKAEGLLKAVEALLLVATIGTKANAGTPPSKDNIKKLMAQPGGQKILDDMIAALPASAQQDVLITVLEARFNMDVRLFADEAAQEAGTEKSDGALDVPAPKLMAYYEMLKSVPEGHTKLNPSLARFDQVEDGSGSYYQGSAGAVVMGCFTAMDASGNPLGAPSELDEIDDDSKVRTDTPNPTYGKWTTLHEIGHAVDDRQSFMDKNGSADAYGGWVTYGSNIAPVAKAVAEHYKYDSSFIERTMAGGTPPNPDIPPDVIADKGDDAQAEWDKRKADFIAWYAGVRSTTNIWDNASETKKWAIGTTVYHEAYPNTWVSYKISARSKGVTGYQFRAPGEWFSELYAAFHTNKLNENHPARSWLAKL